MFPEETEAFEFIYMLTWLAPVVLTVVSILDYGLVLVFHYFLHPWIGIVREDSKGDKERILNDLKEMLTKLSENKNTDLEKDASISKPKDKVVKGMDSVSIETEKDRMNNRNSRPERITALVRDSSGNDETEELCASIIDTILGDSMDERLANGNNREEIITALVHASSENDEAEAFCASIVEDLFGDIMAEDIENSMDVDQKQEDCNAEAKTLSRTDQHCTSVEYWPEKNLYVLTALNHSVLADMGEDI